MFIELDGQNFLVGTFSQVVSKIKKITPQKSTIFLPCSLNDLAQKSQNKKISNLYKEVDICTTDSMFITKWLDFKKKQKIERVYGPDLMKALIKESKGKNVLLGPDDETLKKLKNLLNLNGKNFEFISLKKTDSDQKEKEVIKDIINKKPNFVWIGLGSPKQIELAVLIKKQTKKVSIFCVGAAFEFLSKQKKQAPIWMQKNGLEWLFRLISEPARLWKRYLLTIPKYLILKTLRINK
ncbi:MAG: WecB/TagA/CpsF family glycosyltransferase [Candidatus Pacebacteria bacterium]|nr:WecB/TagA/CpsF family glycosyltransferase [Candidatus Paceibacterota bacterium]